MRGEVMGPTERAEEHEIERAVNNRLGLPETVGQVALKPIIIERTEVAQQGFDSMGTYITSEW